MNNFKPNPKDFNPSQYAAKLAKKTPRNLQEVPSAHDIDPVNAPKNIYDQSSMARMLDAKKQYEEAQKHSSYKKIIGGI